MICEEYAPVIWSTLKCHLEMHFIKHDKPKIEIILAIDH